MTGNGLIKVDDDGVGSGIRWTQQFLLRPGDRLQRRPPFVYGVQFPLQLTQLRIGSGNLGSGLLVETRRRHVRL